MNIIPNLLRIILLFFIHIPIFAKDDFSSGKRIAVRWTLQSNFDATGDNFTAHFTLINKSNFNLTERNWNLYFNVAPRTVINPKESKAAIEQINGDWFRLIPLKGFLLAPGDSIVIPYQGYPAMIKHTDAPAGLYFVFYDVQGKEQAITPVMDYRHNSFVNDNQIHRSSVDLEPIPTPEWMYFNNVSLSPLPAEGLRETIPSPVSVLKSKDSLLLTRDFRIVYHPKLKNEAVYLKESVKKMLGWDLKLDTGASCKKCLLLEIENTEVKKSDGSYTLGISEKGVVIHAGSEAGVFYGIQTFRSYFPLNSIDSHLNNIRIPLRTITDAPRFEYRGLALDVARNFQSKETVLKLIDLLAYYKINRLLLVMADDEGWRIEINGLPELTAIGGKREHLPDVHNAALHPSYGSGPFGNSPDNHGTGYYTRSDFVEIIKYAATRHIKVIPEFNLPAHAKAAIKAMEARHHRFAAVGKLEEANEFRLRDPSDTSRYLSAQSYRDNTASVADSSTFRFAFKVVSEMERMYRDGGLTLDEIHVGGDEVPHGAWAGSPLAHQLLEADPEIKNIAGLQSYYFARLLKMLHEKRLQIDAWDDVLMTKNADGSLSVNEKFKNDNIVPFIWNNIFDHPDLAYLLANAGYKVVMCNVSNFYFDLAYNKDPNEPGAYWGGFVDTKDAWGLAPFDMFKTSFTTPMGNKLKSADFDKYERLTESGKQNILGVQAQVFSETIKGRDMLEYYLLPKLIGFSETAWASERAWETIKEDSSRIQLMNADWNSFANVLASRELPRLKLLNGGYNYRIPPPGAIIENGFLKANCEYPGLKIYYADLNGGAVAFKEYTTPAKVGGDVMLKCIDSCGGSSRVIKISNH